MNKGCRQRGKKKSFSSVTGSPLRTVSLQCCVKPDCQMLLLAVSDEDVEAMNTGFSKKSGSEEGWR